jgi:hypothetical protein
MGCNQSRKDIDTHEEFAMQMTERILGLSDERVDDTELTFKKWAPSSQITFTQLEKILNEVGANTQQINRSQFPIGNFYKQFKIDPTLYNMDLLVTMAVLVGKGDAQLKWRVLFEHYDVNIYKFINIESFEKILSDMIQISIDFLPELSIGTGPELVNARRMAAYISNMKKTENVSRKALVDKVFAKSRKLTKE